MVKSSSCFSVSILDECSYEFDSVYVELKHKRDASGTTLIVAGRGAWSKPPLSPPFLQCSLKHLREILSPEGQID